jgi:uncharacterized membrane protein YfcA
MLGSLLGLWMILFFLIAFLYSAVGHGGASGYLALMSFFLPYPELMKPIALLLNLVVSGIALVQFYRQGHFLWRVFVPIALCSIPMAYLGGFTPLKDEWYQMGLGVFLLVSVVLLNVDLRGRIALKKEENIPVFGVDSNAIAVNYKWAACLMGGGIGYVSGLLGIGGGILLSPVLLLLGWTQQKQTAALSAAFIFVNSTSGLFGSIQQHPLWESPVSLMDIAKNTAQLDVYWITVLMTVGTLILPVVLGGVIGSWYGAKKFSHLGMKAILSLVLLIAAIKLLLS